MHNSRVRVETNWQVALKNINTRREDCEPGDDGGRRGWRFSEDDAEENVSGGVSRLQTG